MWTGQRDQNLQRRNRAFTTAEHRHAAPGKQRRMGDRRVAQPLAPILGLALHKEPLGAHAGANDHRRSFDGVAVAKRQPKSAILKTLYAIDRVLHVMVQPGRHALRQLMHKPAPQTVSWLGTSRKAKG